MPYIWGNFVNPIMFRIFKPQHKYRPSHWLTAIPMLEDELYRICYGGENLNGGRKLLVVEMLYFLLKQEDYLNKKVKAGDKFLPLRLSWKEMDLLDSLWWGTRPISEDALWNPRPLSDEELSQVRASMVPTGGFQDDVG
jgi:hypothetical protein